MDFVNVFLELATEDDYDDLLSFFKEPMLLKKKYAYEDKKELSRKVLGSLTVNMIKKRKKNKSDPLYVYINKVKKEFVRFPSGFTDQLMYLLINENKVSQANGFLLLCSNNLEDSNSIIEKTKEAINSNQYYLKTFLNEIPEEEFNSVNVSKERKNIIVDYLSNHFSENNIKISTDVKNSILSIEKMSSVDLISTKFKTEEDRIFSYLKYIEKNTEKIDKFSFLLNYSLDEFFIELIEKMNKKVKEESTKNDAFQKELTEKEEVVNKYKKILSNEVITKKNLEKTKNTSIFEMKKEIENIKLENKRIVDEKKFLKEDISNKTKTIIGLTSQIKDESQKLAEITEKNNYINENYIKIDKQSIENDFFYGKWIFVCSKDYEFLCGFYPELLIMNSEELKKLLIDLSRNEYKKIFILTRAMSTFTYKKIISEIENLDLQIEISTKEFRSLKETIDWIGYQKCIEKGIE